jgi:parallel beta-helix repeat protein
MLASITYLKPGRLRLAHLNAIGRVVLSRTVATACVAACTAAAFLPATGAAALASTSSQTVVVTTLASSGGGSLRAAIIDANAASPGTSTVIQFTVEGTIKLGAALPAIRKPAVIDATSGWYGSSEAPAVEIDANGHAGLRFVPGSGGSRLLGVAVGNAAGDGVTLDAGGITLNYDYIGLNLAGKAFGNHGAGVFLSPSSSHDVIGANTSGASGVVANVISGNTGSGIVLSGSSRNVVAANRIGTSPNGKTAIGNGGDGISVTNGSDHNRIGGPRFVDSATGKVNNPTGSEGTVTPVFVVPPDGNLISGNRGNGVFLGSGSQQNVLNGNFIGTTAKGDAALGNDGNGVRIDGADSNSLAGCKFVTNPFVFYNVVSGNHGNGLRVTDSDGTVVQGDFFGDGANNSAIVGNRLDGIRIDGSSRNTQVGGVIPLGNVAAGNGHNGIDVRGTASDFTTFNTFGGLQAFKGAAPNGRDGLLITSSGKGNLVRTNVFSGNTGNGIHLAGDANDVTVDPDIAGLTTKGNAPLPNGRNGLLINGNAHGNVIGGNLRSVILQDTFSGNLGYGVVIRGSAHHNVVFTSFIGAEILGRTALANRKGGVLVAGSAHGNSVGAVLRRPRNLISGNTGNGVTLTSRTFHNRVVGNVIGLNRLRQPLPNSGKPIVNRGHNNRIRRNRT